MDVKYEQCGDNFVKTGDLTVNCNRSFATRQGTCHFLAGWKLIQKIIHKNIMDAKYDHFRTPVIIL